jgi:glycosyltransferase involved in cell wall biosynthesis
VKILFLISSEGHYGVESMMVTLAARLHRMGCSCIVGVFRDGRSPHLEVAERAQQEGLPVEVIPCRGRIDFQTVKRLRRLLLEQGVDVIHPQGYKSDIYAYLAAWPHRVALVATSHNWPSRKPSMRAYAALDRRVLRKFDRTVVVSDAVRDLLGDAGVVPGKICSIPNGVNIERFKGAAPTLRQELGVCGPLVGTVGRLVAEKGGESLLLAAQKLLKSQADTRFVFIGEGPCREEWQALAVQLGIANRVVFVGARADMPEVYASLDVIVLPSLVEALPMCLLEAMAAGKPVVATRVGMVPRVVLPERTGLLVEPGDAVGLAGSIERLLRDRELAACLGIAGQKKVSEQFSDDAMAKQYVELYSQVLSEGGRADRASAVVQTCLR